MPSPVDQEPDALLRSFFVCALLSSGVISCLFGVLAGLFLLYYVRSRDALAPKSHYPAIRTVVIIIIIMLIIMIATMITITIIVIILTIVFIVIVAIFVIIALIVRIVIIL